MAENTQSSQSGADWTTSTVRGLGTAASIVGQGIPYVGMAVSILSSFGQANQKKAWAKYQAKQAKADGLAQLKGSYVEADKIRKAARSVQSQAVAATANSGVVVGEGTAGQVEKQIRQSAEEDALMAIYDGQDAYKRSLAQAKAYKINGSSEYKSSLWQKSSSLFGAAGLGFGALGKWLKSYGADTSASPSATTTTTIGGK